MPTFCFICDRCGVTETATDRYVPAWCDQCPDREGVMRRDWKAEAANPLIANLKQERESAK